MSPRRAGSKLSAPPIFEIPTLSDAGVLTGTPTTRDRHRAYWDTEDLRLARAGVVLSHRDDAGWFVELPALHPDTPGTVVETPGDPDAAPEAARDLVWAFARAAPLVPVARLRTRATLIPLESATGTPLGMLADEQVEVLDGERVMGTYRELEVTPTDDVTPAQVEGVLEALHAAGAGPVDETPPIVRALGARATAPADVAPMRVGREAHLGDLFRAALSASVAALVAHDHGIRRGTDPEDVHQARVATRRLRSHLRTFGDFVDGPWADALGSELQWLGNALGAVRDAEVRLDVLEAYSAHLGADDQHVAEQLFERIRAEHATARTGLLGVLRSDRYVELLDQLVLAARRPRLLLRIDDADEHDVLREVARRPWERLVEQAEALPDDPVDGDLHKVRLLTKRARYAVESVEPAFGKPARALLGALTDVQDVLGRHNDAVGVGTWLRDTTRGGDPSTAFAAGALAAVAGDDARQARAAWPRTWRRARRKKLVTWM